LKKKHVVEMLFKMYKELMILGICSLFLFFEEKYHLTEDLIGEFDKHMFEHVHMMLFVVVLLYITVTVFLMIYCVHVAGDYAIIQEEAIKEGPRITQEWVEYENKVRNMNGCFHALYAAFNLSYGRAHFKFMYAELRKMFEEQHKKELLEGHFDFHIYLRKCVRQACINIAMIHWQVWLTILIVILANTIRILIFSVDTIGSFVYFDAIVLWVVTFYVFYLRHNATSVLDALSSSPQAYQRYSKLSHEDREEEEEEREEAEKDEEEAMHHEESRIMHGGYCNKRTTEQHKLFVFHSPSSISRGIQLALLMVCISVPLYIMELSDSIHNDSDVTKFLINLSIGIPPVLLLLFGFPPLVPRFVIAASVASMSRPNFVRATVELLKHRHDKKNKKKGSHVRGHKDEEISIGHGSTRGGSHHHGSHSDGPLLDE